MSKKLPASNRKLLVSCILTAIASNAALAQDQDLEVEEIVVTGSLIRGTPVDAPSPVQIIDRGSIEQTGAAQIWDVIKNLNINAGSTTNTNPNVGDGITATTSNINLRNLGTNATLTLINGKRATPVAGATKDGSEFVDLNTIPMVMVERMEILTDGGSALYGSDAIAGVVNVIMRTEFEGFELYGDVQAIEGVSNAMDRTASAIWGWTSSDQRTHMVLAGEYFERDETTIKASSLYDSNSRVTGSTGNYVLLPGFGFTPNPTYINEELTAIRNAAGATGPVYTDPLCRQLGYDYGTRNSRDTSPTAACQADHTDYEYLAPGEERMSFVASLSHELNDNVEVYSVFQIADQDSLRSDNGSVSLTGLGPFTLPPFGTTSDPIGSGAQLGAFAGVAGNSIPTVTNAPVSVANGGPGVPNMVTFESNIPFPGNRGLETNNNRYDSAQLGARGDFQFLDRELDYDVSYSWGRSDVLREDAVQVRNRAELAMNGLGGPNCTPNGIPDLNLDAIPYWQIFGPTVFLEPQQGFVWNLRESASYALTSSNQGQGDCHFFNPYLTRVTDPALSNSDELIDWIVRRVPISDRTNTMGVFDASVTGNLFELPGGTAAFALGYQNRVQDFVSRTYDLVQPGLDAILSYGPGVTGAAETHYVSNDNNYGGHITLPYDNHRNVDAVFLELSLPVVENVETQLAVRYEDYGGGIGSEVSPKLAVSWRPIEELLLRSSYSQSFRAPNASIIYNGQGTNTFTYTDPLVNPLVLAGLLPANDANALPTGTLSNPQPSPNIGNEYADTYNLGFRWTPSGRLDGLSVGMDFWRFDFTDRVVAQPPSEVVGPQIDLFNSVASDPANYVTRASLASSASIPFVPCDPVALSAQFGADSPERSGCYVDPRKWAVPGINRDFEDGDPQTMNLAAVNAGNIITDGVDVRLGYDWEHDWGNFRVGVEYTHVRQYTIKDLPGFETGFSGTGVFDAAGTTGDGGLTLTSLPDNRGSITFNWTRNRHGFTAVNRHIGSYDNLSYDGIIATGNATTRALAKDKVDSYSAWDLQYNYTHNWATDLLGTTVLTLGVLDAFEAEIPYLENNGASTLYNYDVQMFDPRGRRIYLRALMQF
ncbi:MAG: TonB-dependent receptor [Pseudohongiellaceae bacterium]